MDENGKDNSKYAGFLGEKEKGAAFAPRLQQTG